MITVFFISNYFFIMTQCIIIKDEINYNTKCNEDFIKNLILHILNKENYLNFRKFKRYLL